MKSRYLLLTILVLVISSAATTNENDRVTCYIDFDIFVSQKEQFCNGNETVVNGNLKDGIYFQYRTNNDRPWITVDIYNATSSIKENVLEFQSNDVQFRWIQYDTIGSPSWAIDDIVIYCTFKDFFKSISFEEDPGDFNKYLICHSGFKQQGAKDCTDTEHSLLLNGTNRELRTIFFNLLNGTFQESNATIPNHCQPQVCIGPSLSHGLVWSTTLVNETVRIQCSEISEIFWSGLNATRKCLDGGVWDEVDMSQCTVKDTDGIPFIVYSTYLQTPDNISNSSISTINQLQQSLDVYNISATLNVKLYTEETSVILTVFIISFDDDILVQGNTMATVIDVAKHIDTVEVNYTIPFQGFPEIVLMHPVDVCQCNNSFTVENEQQSITVVNVCVGISIPPCISDDSDIGSKVKHCNEPHYTGNVTNCAIVGTSDAYDCDEGYDMEFGIRWEGSRKNFTVSRICPNGTGNTSRSCKSLGNWDVPDVRRCSSTIYHNLFERICNISEVVIDFSELSSFLMDFAETVRQTNFSIFPLDLKIVNNIMGKILIAIEEDSTLLNMNITESLLTVYDSIFDGKNEPGFKQLMEINRTENQMLIVHSEKLGMLLATNTDIENGELTETNFTRENFVLSVQRSPVKDITFRLQLSQYHQTSLHIPAQLLEQKPKDANEIVPIVNIVYKTLHRLLPDTQNPNGQMKKPVSIVISSQVGNRYTPSLLPQNNPVTLKFDHNAPDNVSNMTRCAFWNFNLSHTGGDGGWDSTGVIVAEDSHDGHITCHSFHLTCFVVLVDVSGGSNDRGKGESTALSVVTYIGCGISMICLLMAIIFLIIYRNTALNGVHNFAHLNLSIALLLALIVFVAGIETATNNQTACTVVAALLHYLFTAVFSWMLCEGILLYVLLVKVFSFKYTKRKWPYFILGWGVPIPVVAIAVGIAHRHYGNDKFCWISTDNGTIWAFVGPMLLIVLVDTVILIMVLRILFKSKSQKMTTDEAKKVDVVKSVMKATVVLLPLLGVTWVFGLLAVNRNLSVFAWIFTVLNSLQGLFILLFHVLRNKKVRENIGTTVAAYTSSLKSQVTSTLYSSPAMQNKTSVHSTQTSVKIHIEQCEGDTIKSVNGVKAMDNSSICAQTVESYFSERESKIS